MALTQEQILQRSGRPLPPQLPAIADSLKEVVDGLTELGGTVSPTRADAVRSHLASVASNIKADLADKVTNAKILENQKLAAELAAAKAAIAEREKAGQ